MVDSSLFLPPSFADESFPDGHDPLSHDPLALPDLMNDINSCDTTPNDGLGSPASSLSSPPSPPSPILGQAAPPAVSRPSVPVGAGQRGSKGPKPHASAPAPSAAVGSGEDGVAVRRAKNREAASRYRQKQKQEKMNIAASLGELQSELQKKNSLITSLASENHVRLSFFISISR